MPSSPDPTAPPFDVLAFVTSARELEAISVVLADLPAALTAAVLIPYPQSEASTLIKRTGRRTPLPVQWAENGTKLELGHVYVGPPGLILEVRPDRRCVVMPPQGELLSERPLDRLLASLAVSFGERALAVVLTGTRHDGVAGVRALRGAGGMVLVQDPDTSDLAELPRAVMEVGAADLVLPLGDLGRTAAELLAGGRFPQPRGEEARRESEVLHRTLFDVLDEGVCLVERLPLRANGGRDYRFVAMNPAMQAMFGIPDLSGQSGRDHFPDEAEVWYDDFDRVLETGEPVRFERESVPQGLVLELFVTRTEGSSGQRLLAVIRDITGRKRAEAALRESEERFRLFVSASSDIVYRMSADWHRMDLLVGKGFLADTRHPSLTWPEEYIPGSDQAFVQAAIDEAIRTKTMFELEHRVLQADGTVGWTLSRAIPLLDEHGEIVEWFGAASDITERKRTEANLAFLVEVSQDLVRLTNIDETMDALAGKICAHFDASVCGFSEIDEAAGTFTNTHVWHRTGVPSILGTFRIDDYHSEELRRAMRAGEPYVVRDTATDPRTNAGNMAALETGSFVTVPLLRDGVWHFNLTLVDTAARYWRTDEVELLHELTMRIWTRVERARAEEALRVSEEKYRTLFESVDEGFCLLERVDGEWIDFRYVEANPAFARQIGVGDVVGKTIRELFPGAPEEGYAMYEHVWETGEPVTTELDVPSIGYVLELQTFRVEGAAGRRVAVVFKDITERKRAEQRQAFLLRLSDALGPLQGPVEIQDAVTREAMTVFHADRCYYCEVIGDSAVVRRDAAREGLPSVAGTYPLSSFALFTAVVEAGRPLIVDDVQTTDLVDDVLRQLCLELQVISFIDIPVIKQGQAAGILCLVQGNPRHWTNLEVELATETAERTWAAVERARAEEAVRVLNATLEERVEERTRRLADLNSELGNFITRTAHNLEAPARHLGHLLDPARPSDPRALDGLPPYDPVALRDEVTRLKGVARDLRQLSGLEGHELTRELLPLRELFEEVRAEVSPQGSQVTWRIEPLPIVRGDHALLRQALEVLMTFTLSETRGARYVTVGSREVEGEVQVTVEDDGLGLTGEEAATLFDLAVRTDQEVPLLEGSGLVQVRRILARHGGWAWAEAQRTSGKVVLAFPRDEAVNELEALFRQDKPGR